MSKSRKLTSLVSVVLLAGLTLSACGDKDKDDAGTKAKSSSSASTSDTKLTKDNFATEIGDAMIKSGSAHVVMKGGAGAQTLAATGDQQMGASPDDSAIALKLDTSGMEMEMRLVDQVLYFNMGAMTGNKFAKLDLTDKDNPLVSQFGQFTEQADLASQFEAFQDALTGFEQKGESKQIDGVAATPYDITVDTAKMGQASGADTSALPKEFTYTFYVGPDNLVRRMVTSTSGVDLTMDYSKWGQDVDIKAPADSEVSDQDISKLLSGMAGA